MSNMSYCRFENTSKDLMDCVEAINNRTKETDDLNSYEADGLENLLEYSKQIVDNASYIEEVIEESRDNN